MSLPKSIDDFDLSKLGFESLIKSKPEARPQFTCIFGKGGIGKTSTACYSPSPIIIPVGRETGAERMDVPKFPSFNEMNLSPVHHVFACLAWIIKAEHTRKTLIIDNVGAFREAVEEDVEDSNKDVKDLKAYGRGAALGYPYWTRLLAGIDAVMKKRDMHVILIAHDGMYNVNLSDGSYYQKISINAPRGENTNAMGLLEARCHNVFYMTEEAQTINVKTNFGTTKKIATSGATVRGIYTKPASNFFAKSRVNMEEYYQIESSPTEEELLTKKTNPDIIKFWADLYRK